MSAPDSARYTPGVAQRLVAAARGTSGEFHAEIRSARAAVAALAPEDERVELLDAILQTTKRPTPEGHCVRMRLLKHLAATATA